MTTNWEESAARADQWDRVIRAAVSAAALAIQPGAGERVIAEQRNLVPALSDALTRIVGAENVSVGKRLLTQQPLPDWDPLPGPIDLMIGEPPNPPAHPSVGIEAKSRSHPRKLGEASYDVFKMAALRRLEGVEATYLVVAATQDAFNTCVR